MAAILVGTPAILIPADLRVRELAKQHDLPFIDAKSLGDGLSLCEIYERADFTAYSRSYAQKFEHYLSFLRQNGIDNIYDRGMEANAPYDRLLSQTPPTSAIRAGERLPLGEMRYIPQMYLKLLRYKLDRRKQ